MKIDKKVMIPIAGATMVAGTALVMSMRPKKKGNMQKAAGRAIKAVGEAVENFPGSMKM